MGRYNIFKKEITQTEFRRLTITCYHLIIKQSDKQLSTSVRMSTLSFTLPGQHVTCLLQLSE